MESEKRLLHKPFDLQRFRSCERPWLISGYQLASVLMDVSVISNVSDLLLTDEQPLGGDFQLHLSPTRIYSANATARMLSGMLPTCSSSQDGG